MRIPSIKSMKSANFPQPEKIRARMEKFRDYCKSHPSLKVSVEKCLNDISEITDDFGYYWIAPGHNEKSPEIHFVNKGDTYETTILFVNGNFRIGCWGDIVERGNYS